jgi:hypothetical protein
MTIDPRILDPGERVLWSAHPHAGDYASQRGLLWCVGGLFLTGTTALGLFGPQEMNVPSLLLLGGFALLGICFTLTPAWRFYEAKHMTYAVTDRRVLIQTSGFLPWRRSIPFRQIQYVEMEPSDENDVGNIYFQAVVVAEGEGNALKREGFLSVPDAENAERLVRRALNGLPDSRLRVVSS